MTNEESNENEKIKGLMSSGAEIAGGALGGALGFLAGGPIGAAAGGAGGAAVAVALKHIGTEVSDRVLAPREKVRAGGVLAIAASNIDKRINAGEKTREDNFFTTTPNSNRSKGEEIVESVILKAQKEPEERKIPFMGNLLSNISFDKTISVELGHQIIKTAEQLTYRQLCILKLSAVRSQLNIRQQDYRGQDSFPKELYQVLYEFLDLYSRGLINFGGDVAFGPTDVKPGATTIQGMGADVFNLMGLIDIPDQDVLTIAKTVS
ncbi:hypothetical protein [Amphritea sp.]|uniref:hypothetical protein n=1 Tax=Amphritea sp. TaxID=1872502 RepID=UPI0025BB5A4F|nr:hypothetical protein [Amphritea sp.]